MLELEVSISQCSSQGLHKCRGRMSSLPCRAPPSLATRFMTAIHRRSAQLTRHTVEPLLHPLTMCSGSLPAQHTQNGTHNGTGVGSSLPPLLPLDGDYEARHTYTPLANWLIPGRVMLGRYPYVEPSRCRSHDDGDEQIRLLLQKAGIRTFVCLQAEIPPQKQMRVGGKGGFIPYAPTATLYASSLAGPPAMEVMTGLRNEYLDQYLPPRRRRKRQQNESGESDDSPEARSSPEKLQFVHSPIVDLGIPSLEQMTELVEDLQQRLEKGEVMYVHCWGGRGRAGTVGACLLIKAYGLDADEALARVQRAFDTRQDEGRPSPETSEQKQFVRKFADLQKRHSNGTSTSST